jgi:hypothetical protein
MNKHVKEALERHRQLAEARKLVAEHPGAAVGLEFAQNYFTRFTPITAELLERRLRETLSERKNPTAFAIGIEYVQIGREVIRILWRDSNAKECGLLARIAKRYTPAANVEALVMAAIAALQAIRQAAANPDPSDGIEVIPAKKPARSDFAPADAKGATG